MFDYVLARSRARETSILAVATIASSASIVLLGLVFQCNCALSDSTKLGVTILGISLAGIGLLYREGTKAWIHDNDDCWLKAYVQFWRVLSNEMPIGEMVIDGDRIKDPIPPFKHDYMREIFIRTLLVIPIIAWSFFFIHSYVGIIIAGLSIGLIVGFSSCGSSE